MPQFRFNCPSCNHLVRNANVDMYKFCPYCGVGLYKRRDDIYERKEGDSRDTLITIVQFKKLLSPIVELNGYTWLADKVGVDEKRIRIVFSERQKFVTLGLAERWLIKLGLENALRDGTLTIITKGQIPEPPESVYFED